MSDKLSKSENFERSHGDRAKGDGESMRREAAGTEKTRGERYAGLGDKRRYLHTLPPMKHEEAKHGPFHNVGGKKSTRREDHRR